MIKRVLFSFALMLTVFACMGLANVPHYRLKFTVNSAFMLEKNADCAVPAGEYWVKDEGTAPGHLLSLRRSRDLKLVAFLNTIRIDRAVQNWTDKTSVVFDYENTNQVPVLRKFLVPGNDGYEILSAVYNKKSDILVDIATLSKTTFTKYERTVETETKTETEAAPPAAPEVEQPAPIVEQPRQQEEVQPAPAPIRERKRVRKD